MCSRMRARGGRGVLPSQVHRETRRVSAGGRDACLRADSRPVPAASRRLHRSSHDSRRSAAPPRSRRASPPTMPDSSSRLPRVTVSPSRRSSARPFSMLHRAKAGCRRPHRCPRSRATLCRCSTTPPVHVWRTSGLPSAGPEASQTHSCAWRTAGRSARPLWAWPSRTSPTSADS